MIQRIAVLTVVLVALAFGQWGPDMRLTNNSAISQTSCNNAWCVAVSGSVVHAVWSDNRDGNYEIYYKRSTDGGMSWGTDARLTISSYVSESPAVAVSGSTVHVVWQESNGVDIFYRRSSDGGASWDTVVRLTNNPYNSVSPSLAVSGSTVHLVWKDDRTGPLSEIFYKRSSDGGMNWSADTRLTNSLGTSEYPSLVVRRNALYLVWCDWRTGGAEIYFKQSADSGLTWDGDRRLTNSGGYSQYPSVAHGGSTVHVFWQDNRAGTYQIYYMRSTDNGWTWGAETRLTTTNLACLNPSSAANGVVAHVVWSDRRFGMQHSEIYCKRSTDGGSTWGGDTRLTNAADSSKLASVVDVGTGVHAVWMDRRDGNFEIYYKRGYTGNVGCTQIVAPTDAVYWGTVLTPSCRVVNPGSNPVSYVVRMKIGPQYNQTATVVNHSPGTTIGVSFPNWTARPGGTLAVTCSTELDGDVNSGNDRQTGSVFVRCLEAQCLTIDAPTGTVDSGATVAVRAKVRNNGTDTATFDVQFVIPGVGYVDTQWVGGLPPGDSTQVWFANWIANVPRGTYTPYCSTMCAFDTLPGNDRFVGSPVSLAVRDVQPTAITAPTGSVDSGASVPVSATVRNNGTASATFDVRMVIPGTGYLSTQTVSGLSPGASTPVTFANWVANVPRGSYTPYCTTMLANDMVVSNNRLTGSPISMVVRDAEAVSIIAPVGAIDSGQTITPQANVRNNGTQSASFSVRFDIGAWNNTQTVTSLPAGTTQLVNFSNWTATQRGAFATSCTTQLSGDLAPANNRVTGTVSVRVVDAEVLAITAPSGSVDSGAVVMPLASVRNNSSSTETFDVRLQIGTWSDSRTVTLASGASQVVGFNNWTAVQRGSHNIRCTTVLAGDMVPSNDFQTSSVAVAVHDVAARAILTPPPETIPGSITPRARVLNLGTGREPVELSFSINSSPPYHGTVNLAAGLPVGTDTTVEFTPWLAVPGSYTARCSVYLSTDQIPANNATGIDFRVISPELGWVRKTDLPVGGRSKNVKDGGSLAYYEGVTRWPSDQVTKWSNGQVAGPSASLDHSTPAPLDRSSGYIYAFKGNNRTEFYQYNPEDNTWATRESLAFIGSSGKKKGVKKGASLTSEAGMLYGTKGGGLAEFWRYDPALSGTPTYPWTQMRDVPGVIKEGSGMVALDGYVYLLRGTKSQDLLRYDVAGNVWTNLAPAPLGVSGKPFKNGSSITLDPANKIIYALKNSYGEFYAYDITGNNWSTKATLPRTGTAGKKKVGAGSGTAYANGYVYALKGGNTYEFWSYLCDSDRWIEKENILPGAKKVKGGGALAFGGGDVGPAGIYALKGNNTLEFYRYTPAAADGSRLTANSSQQTMTNSSTPELLNSLTITPNPFTGAATISYSLPKAGPVSLKLYDVTGKLVRTLAEGRSEAGTSSFIVHRSGLNAGIYVLRLAIRNSQPGTSILTRKLIIE